ncbi:MAG: hypothetical protein RMY36_033530 [Nostoc sp. SerVER01]|nr:hypothetical protein [Nostoc sp. SerVER01]MDZ8074923.1 hypothetical protein [Nostoc sp. DedQUE01]MDZ8083495.1 hypothetical protein [Nostoc sp. DcaGUA01]
MIRTDAGTRGRGEILIISDYPNFILPLKTLKRVLVLLAIASKNCFE